MEQFKFFRNIVSYDRHNTIWKTATGKHLPVLWMTNTHIMRCLSCLRGTGEMRIPNPHMGKTNLEWIDIFKQELRTREEEECRGEEH